MEHINDEAAALAGVAASKAQSRNTPSIADSKSKSNHEVARPLTATSLVTVKQAHRIVRAVSRDFDAQHPTAWLLGIGTGPGPLSLELSQESGIAPGGGPSGCAEEHNGIIYLDHSIIALGTLLNAVAIAIMPAATSRAESLSWSDRFWECVDEILSLARRLIRPAERLDSAEVYACWERKWRASWTWVTS